ncbi:hypothetical protein QE152_g1680 [Popillia japonica]|uniref:Uncharacterized protein n=1 Tax=Popillia japonica TaxID=7064 RepID=A0AAW1N6E7_POPJA
MDINIEDDKEEFCDGCALGKMHRLPFKQRMNRPTVTGELIHADVNGPMTTESFGGARYYVCFKDDFKNRKNKRQRRKPVWIENVEFVMMAGAVGKEHGDPNSGKEHGDPNSG